MSNFTLALPISEINMVTHSFIPVHFYDSPYSYLSILPSMSPLLSCTLRRPVCVPRLESMWNEELKRGGKDGVSLSRVLWRFCQTRMLVAVFALLLTMVAGFVGPVSSPSLAPLFLLLLLSRDPADWDA